MIGAPSVTPMPHFRHKAFAALLASLGGAFGLNRLYLGQGFWWLPLGVTLIALPLIGRRQQLVPDPALLRADGARGGGVHPGADYCTDAR